jgi:hypothetical protein
MDGFLAGEKQNRLREKGDFSGHPFISLENANTHCRLVYEHM